MFVSGFVFLMLFLQLLFLFFVYFVFVLFCLVFILFYFYILDVCSVRREKMKVYGFAKEVRRTWEEPWEGELYSQYIVCKENPFSIKNKIEMKKKYILVFFLI